MPTMKPRILQPVAGMAMEREPQIAGDANEIPPHPSFACELRFAPECRRSCREVMNGLRRHGGVPIRSNGKADGDEDCIFQEWGWPCSLVPCRNSAHGWHRAVSSDSFKNREKKCPGAQMPKRKLLWSHGCFETIQRPHSMQQLLQHGSTCIQLPQEITPLPSLE